MEPSHFVTLATPNAMLLQAQDAQTPAMAGERWMAFECDQDLVVHRRPANQIKHALMRSCLICFKSTTILPSRAIVCSPWSPATFAAVQRVQHIPADLPYTCSWAYLCAQDIEVLRNLLGQRHSNTWFSSWSAVPPIPQVQRAQLLSTN
jgi:hypothetical protein